MPPQSVHRQVNNSYNTMLNISKSTVIPPQTAACPPIVHPFLGIINSLEAAWAMATRRPGALADGREAVFFHRASLPCAARGGRVTLR
jgi:hypothetical protein